MSGAAWKAADDHIAERLIGDDAALDAAPRASAEAGLPPIAVSPPQGRPLHLLARSIGAARRADVARRSGRSRAQLADEAHAAGLALIPGGQPEVLGAGVLLGDDRREAFCAEPRQSSLARAHERCREPSPARLGAHREPVEAAAPTVPCDDQRAGESAAVASQQQRLVVAREQPRQTAAIRAGSRMGFCGLP
jgi:hypothetical protein